MTPFLLAGLVTFLLLWRRLPVLRTLLRFLPVPFWCYFLPMLAGTFGLLPSQHPFYAFLSEKLLPVCLGLLIIGADCRGIARLSRLSVWLMAIGTAGTLIGGIVSFFLYRPSLPDKADLLVAALCASWTGGSANLIAVKEALNISDSLIGPVIVTDAFFTYGWMALLIAGAGWSGRWEHLLGGTAGEILQDEPPAAGSQEKKPILPGVGIILLSILLAAVSGAAGAHIPAGGQIISPAAWTIFLVTTGALFVSALWPTRLKPAFVSKMGTFLLFLLLASIGARADVRGIFQTPVFLLLGFTWICIHGLVLLAGGYLLKAPLGLIAIASQANIGGPVSTPLVGASYHPSLTTAGLLMAIAGGLIGTYVGLLASGLIHLLTGS
ncbi:MAG: DUF819 family protein [Candidatus Omnitrophica bacterium]|nr:DUF819 family protein [Candidatus Omnitrophota bacterium]